MLGVAKEFNLTVDVTIKGAVCFDCSVFSNSDETVYNGEKLFIIVRYKVAHYSNITNK